MSYNLLQGSESKKRIELLISLTSIRSEKMTKALHAHFTDGVSEKMIPMAYGVTQSNFNRDRHKLNEVNAVVERIKEIDWERFRK